MQHAIHQLTGTWLRHFSHQVILLYTNSWDFVLNLTSMCVLQQFGASGFYWWVWSFLDEFSSTAKKTLCNASYTNQVCSALYFH